MGENGTDGTNGKNSLTIRDNRTGESYEVQVHEGDVIEAMDLRGIRVNEDDFGMMSYDPAFKNTASTRSTVTYIDGDKGILRYRGYPIEQLEGELPRGGVSSRGSCPTRTSSTSSCTTSRSTRTCTRTCSPSWTASATTPTPWA